MPAHESPELVDLFTAYTAGPDSIGAHLRASAARTRAGDPLLVVTGADMALYPGDGGPPTVLPYRLSNRGFKELAAVSHLGTALASLIELRHREPDGTWRRDADRLLHHVRRARAANSTALWRDRIAAISYRGREADIAAMIDYACAITERYLVRALADPSLLDHRTLRETYLDDGHHELPVSFNRIMVATFFLVGLDTSHRLITWLDDQGIDWTRTMVVVVGRIGRPTAGVTWRTNGVAGMVLAASRGELPLDRLYIAPHAAGFATPVDGDLREVRAVEGQLRQLWAGTRVTVELGAAMFEGYPAFCPGDADLGRDGQTVTRAADVVSEQPLIRAVDDWLTLITRLRLVMEDPRQLLSGAVTDYAAQQLIAHANDPRAVTVPGLDNEPYPAHGTAHAAA
ncbi:DUF5624 domain-containing protein [Streptomyces sp. NBC_00878]|uniref:DUF5624 domain-containing protein n=1 Tax=Streptomyces sp. NBC_00878 TaxID=2975854 RepID=UPI0022545A7B|nr:DUF5624 domain-containing protein [Streptomyces sp. NBC_00878]MCX4911696.1 DUF5624 domain-containing protein [Streptomyces sp. NBC_00878]